MVPETPTRVAFVCVRNAGRSQMATAFAERERRRRGLGDEIEIAAGGTHPAAAVHEVVLEAMDEVGIDIGDREPREITGHELAGCDIVATMGCSDLQLPEGGPDVRGWDLPDPRGRELATVRGIRDEIEAAVVSLFDEIEASGSPDR